jgi:hypothetical protein
MTLRGMVSGAVLLAVLGSGAGANDELNCGTEDKRAVACDELANRHARSQAKKPGAETGDKAKAGGGNAPAVGAQPDEAPDLATPAPPINRFAEAAATLVRLRTQTAQLQACHTDIVKLIDPTQLTFKATCTCMGTTEIKADADEVAKLAQRLDNLGKLTVCLKEAARLTQALSASLASGTPPPAPPPPLAAEETPKLRIIDAWAGDRNYAKLQCERSTVANWVRSKCLYDPVKPGADVNSSNALRPRADVMACQVTNVTVEAVCGGYNPNPQGEQLIGVGFSCAAGDHTRRATIVTGGTLTLVCP